MNKHTDLASGVMWETRRLGGTLRVNLFIISSCDYFFSCYWLIFLFQSIYYIYFHKCHSLVCYLLIGLKPIISHSAGAPWSLDLSLAYVYNLFSSALILCNLSHNNGERLMMWGIWRPPLHWITPNYRSTITNLT